MNVEQMSLNSITVDSLGFEDLIRLCISHEIRAIAPWRHLFDKIELSRAKALIDLEGLHVSGLCRGGLFTAPTADGRARAIDDNLRAVEQAAILEADTLVLVCGPVIDGDVKGSQQMVIDGISAIAPVAMAAGVRLSIEPLHPMMASSRSVITLLDQALSIASQFDPACVGVCVDAYHVWWDPRLEDLLQECRGLIQAFHVSDWVTPIQGEMSSRGLMGDGCIDLKDMRESVYQTGYTGYTEVEILSDHWWKVDPEVFARMIVERFSAVV